MPQQNKMKWDTPGKVLEVDASGKLSPGTNPVKDGGIAITELGNSFMLPGFEDAAIAGIPINANLAVYLIKRLYEKMNLISTKTPETKTEVEEMAAAVSWLISLFQNSRAITMDKNALLKTISQPGCEGVRFYPCTKPNEITEAGEPEDIFSFVTVGVDKDGKDLGYVYEKDSADKIVDNIFNVATQSLLSEYTYPPPPKIIGKAAAESTYIIGGYGWENNF